MAPPSLLEAVLALVVLFVSANTVPERRTKEKRESRVNEDGNILNDSGCALVAKERTW